MYFSLMQLKTQLQKVIYVPVFSIIIFTPARLTSGISSNVGNFI